MGVGQESVGQGFGDGLRGNQVDVKADGFQGAGCGSTDGCDATGSRDSGVGDSLALRCLEAFGEGLDGIGAREEEPVKVVEVGERGVGGGESAGVRQLDGGD